MYNFIVSKVTDKIAVAENRMIIGARMLIVSFDSQKVMLTIIKEITNLFNNYHGTFNCRFWNSLYIEGNRI